MYRTSPIIFRGVKLRTLVSLCQLHITNTHTTIQPFWQPFPDCFQVFDLHRLLSITIIINKHNTHLTNKHISIFLTVQISVILPLIQWNTKNTLIQNSPSAFLYWEICNQYVQILLLLYHHHQHDYQICITLHTAQHQLHTLLTFIWSVWWITICNSPIQPNALTIINVISALYFKF